MSASMRKQWANPVLRELRLRALSGKRTGRTPLAVNEPSKQLTCKVPLSDHDLVVRTAASRNLSVAELLRDYIEDGLAKDVSHHYYKAPNNV